MKKFLPFSVVGLLLGALAPMPAQAAVVPDPTIHFTFDNTLSAVSGNGILTPEPTCPVTADGVPCNSASSFGSDGAGGFWQWSSTEPRGGGFTVATDQEIGKTYTITLRFSFSQVSGYRKIVDYLNRVSDTGFYVLDGQIDFYPLGTGSDTFAADEVLDLVAVRTDTSDQANPTRGVFTVYLNKSGQLTQLLSVTDTQGTSIPHVDQGKTILGFFYDDNATSSEATPTGKIWDLKLWRNYALTQTEVQDVTSQSQVTGGGQGSSSDPAPAPYTGPMVTGSSVASSNLKLVGSKLGSISKAVISGQECKILTLSDGTLSLELPVGLAAGKHDVVLHSDYGVLTVQDAFTNSVASLSAGSKVWTKRIGNQVKIVGKNISGIGRVDFVVNGKIVSTVSGGSASTESAYNVFTQDLSEGKNRFEVRLNGKRILRTTYVPKG